MFRGFWALNEKRVPGCIHYEQDGVYFGRELSGEVWRSSRPTLISSVYDLSRKGGKWCPWCGRWSDHQSGAHFNPYIDPTMG